jgi:hypothetical protein
MTENDTQPEPAPADDNDTAIECGGLSEEGDLYGPSFVLRVCLTLDGTAIYLVDQGKCCVAVTREVYRDLVELRIQDQLDGLRTIIHEAFHVSERLGDDTVADSIRSLASIARRWGER